MANADPDWKNKLSKDQYAVLRQKGTEAPFTGALLHNDASGMYSCAACGTEIFSSEHKFDSGSGWPSFYEVKNSSKLKLSDDSSMGVKRTEVTCATCGSHLGHVFNDAPQTPTGQRYCINSVALNFKEKSA